MGKPDPSYLIGFCRKVMPGMLTDACGVDPELAGDIGEDVLTRAEAFGSLPEREQDVLIAPFVEEVFDHRPHGCSLALKAQVTVVVRNSLLEQAHHSGPLASGLAANNRVCRRSALTFPGRAAQGTRRLPRPESL